MTKVMIMTRRFTILISCALAACSGDEDESQASGDGAGDADTGTTGDDEAADDLDGVRLDVGAGATGLGTEGDAESGGHSAGVGEESESDDGGAESDSGDEPVDMTACMPTIVFDALDEHVHELAYSADLMTNQPSANQPIGFLLAPALPVPPATAIRYANVPDLPCDGALMYPPICDGGHCYQVECTGEGTEWMTLVWNQAPLQNDGFEFQHVYTLSSWNDAEPGVEFAIATQAIIPDGTNASMLAKGRFIDHGFYVVEQFPTLHPYGEVQLAYVWENDVFGGSLKIGTFTVAEVDEAGHLQPTGVCPEPET
jgi:hypothetical protein